MTYKMNQKKKKREKSLKTPRPYLSWEQLKTLRVSQQAYIRNYILGKRFYGNKYTRAGSYLADELEKEKSVDETIEFLREMIGLYPKKEIIIDDVSLQEVPLLAKIDALDPEKGVLVEYKTGKDWTQKKVDKHDQLTFYGLCFWLKYGFFPKEIRLYWVETEETKAGDIEYTGRIELFKTVRKPEDYLRLGKEIKEAWVEIKNITERNRI